MLAPLLAVLSKGGGARAQEEVGDEAAMAAGFDEINRLEKTAVSLERQATYRDIYQYFVFAALFFAFAFALVSAMVREQL